MNFIKTICVVVFLQILVLEVYSQINSDEDSGSIEIPDRPENRQAYKSENAKSKPDDPQTFLNLLSKLMGTIKRTVENAGTRVEEKINYKNISHKTKKGLRKAYEYAEKAKKIFLRHLLKH